MRTSAAALELDFTEPSITAAKAVCAVLQQGKGIDRPALLWAMEAAYGSSAADGGWSVRDAYDVLELAQVLYLTAADLPADPLDCLAALTELTASLPTHTVRSEEQIALQQFSTPAPIAYLASLAARVTATDAVLEPSAGTGLLAVFAERVGATLVLNEIDPVRADMLQAAFPTAPISRHDGELIHDLLARSIAPTAVLINPPFSRSIGRHADPLAAFRHLRAALMRLGAGGRCAAILPDRVNTSRRAWIKAAEPRVHARLFREKPVVDPNAPPKMTGGEAGDDAAGESHQGAKLSATLIEELATQRRQILVAHIASDPAMALDLTIFLMAQNVVFDTINQLCLLSSRLTKMDAGSLMAGTVMLVSPFASQN